MRALAVGAVTGTAMLQQSATLPGSAWIAGALIAAVMLLWVGRGRSGLASIVIALCTGLALGYGWAGLVASDRLAARLDNTLEGRDIVIAGTVVGLPQPFERGIRFILDIEESDTPGVSGRVALAWYGSLGEGEPSRVRGGERWRFTVRLKHPHTNANPHGFDYEAWLLEQDIRATGSVRPRGEHRHLGENVGSLGARIDRVRERLRDRFRQAMPGERFAGVLIALVVGDQRAIRTEDWAVFNRTGVSHLMSISGLHVTMIASLGAWLVGFAWRRSSRLLLACPARKAAAVGGVIAATLYCALAGFGIPAQRTLYMLSVAAVALWLDRTQSASRVLALALLVVVAVDPWAVIAPGFWLSFAAVGVIFYTTTRAIDGQWFVAWARSQWAITIGLVPLTIALFQQVSLVSPIANAVAIPVVSLIVTPLALLAALVPVDALAYLAHWVMALLMPVLEWFASLPAATWQQHAPNGWALALALLGVVWLLAPRGVPARAMALPLFAPMLFVLPGAPSTGTAWIDILDIGQGTAIVIRTARHSMVYDAGPAYSVEADAGNRVVVPYLRGEGIGRIDRMMITHLDNDHSGGAVSIASWLPIGMLMSSLPAGHPVQAYSPYRVPCQAGQRWTWDGVDFHVLHPVTDDYERALKTNSMSCVLRINAGGHAMLLTGDIEAREEAILVLKGTEALRADVLLVPHHGSRTSSTNDFIDAVGPRLAVVSAGYRNRFGHPRADIEARYQSRGIHIARTDAGGAVRVELAPGILRWSTYRTTHPRYWR
ncbi:MAG: DNA internalization-related competence protein ComEC/Rec2 [Burkholderiales bacterium]